MDRYDYYTKIEELLDNALSKLNDKDFEWLLKRVKETIEDAE